MDANHLQYVRSMVMKLSLHSRAEHELFLPVYMKDEHLPLFIYIPLFSYADSVYFKELYAPCEFHNITVPFNNKLLEAWCPKLEEYR